MSTQAGVSIIRTFPSVFFLNCQNNVLLESIEQAIHTKELIARSRHPVLIASIDILVFPFAHVTIREFRESEIFSTSFFFAFLFLFLFTVSLLVWLISMMIFSFCS